MVQLQNRGEDGQTKTEGKGEKDSFHAFSIHKTRIKLATEQAFSISGPTAWHSTSLNMRQLAETDVFKRQPKSHFVKAALNPKPFYSLL